MFGVRHLTLALLATLAVVGVAACGSGTSSSSSSGAAKGDAYKIGVVVSLTGTYAGLGTPEKNVLEMEAARINAAGGINGRQVEILVEDDATDEAKAAAATTKLIEQNNVVAVLGASGTGQSMAMRGDIDRAGVPQISMAGGTVITGEFDKNVYQTPWSNNIVVPFVLDAMKARGHAKIAVLSDTGGYGKDGHTVITANVAKKGMTIVADETFNPGDTDMTAQLTKIKQKNVDAVLVWTAGKEGAIIMKNAADLGLKAPFFGGSGQARREFVSGAGKAADGFIFGTGRSLIPANWGEKSEQYKKLTDFAQRYKAKYGEEPDIFAGHAFDALILIEDALKRAGANADAAALNTELEKTAGVIGFGGNFTFSAKDHNGLTSEDLALYEVKDGSWKTIK